MQTSKEKVKNTFDEAASQFDEIGTPFFKYFGKALADFAEIKPDDQVLDIACGKGATTFPLLEKISDKGRIHAIDLSPNMIAECRKLMHERDNCNIDFLVMDAEHLEFENESMDKVVCGFGLFFLPDIEKGMSEIRRVLKPGGSLVFSSWNDDYKLQYLEEIIRKYIPAIGKDKKVVDSRIQDKDFRTIQGIERTLEICGFIKKEIRIENLDCFYKDEEEWIESRWNTAFRMYFELLSDEQYKSFKQEIIENLQHHKLNGKIKIVMSEFLTNAIKPVKLS